MNYLEVTSGCTVISLRQASSQNGSLEEQASHHLSQNPYLFFDVQGIEFTSMNIGELVNLVASFEEIWGNRPHLIGLLHLSDNGKAIFSRIGLAKQLPSFDSIKEALKTIAQ